ncbi:MAG: RsmB/NOP family class I SAM-dependent RNA methyltransferase, partial [Burkholderiales bacterium]
GAQASEPAAGGEAAAAARPPLGAGCRARPQASVPTAVRLSLPDWLYEALAAEYGSAEAEAIGTALLEPAPLDLRVNTLRASVAAARSSLARQGIRAEPIAGLPAGLRVHGKPALEGTQVYAQGWIEVQDAGSQWLAQLVAAPRGAVVVDFCAGAGGKALALAVAMRASGQIYALDVSARRLQRLQPRLARAGVTMVQPMVIDGERDPKLERLRGRADRVLVDAPCSGTGTLRRNPDLKWRLQPQDIAGFAAAQQRILEAAAALVRPGGRLIYATCSLLSAENEAVARAFERVHPEFEPLALEGEGSGRGYACRLPHVHGCDGFFAAGFARRSGGAS